MNLRSFINSWYRLINSYILITDFCVSCLTSLDYLYETDLYL